MFQRTNDLLFFKKEKLITRNHLTQISLFFFLTSSILDYQGFILYENFWATFRMVVKVAVYQI